MGCQRLDAATARDVASRRISRDRQQAFDRTRGFHFHSAENERDTT